MNWSEYNQTLKARRSLTLWLDRQMNGARRATTSRGRCSCFSGEAIQYCLTLKGALGQALLVDNSGMTVSGERERETRQHGALYPRRWPKTHLGVDAQTVEIRAIEVTGNSVGDAPMLPELLVQPPSEERLVSVCAEAKRS